MNDWDSVRFHRENAKKELKLLGFTPSEELPIGHWGINPNITNLQWEWRKIDCRRNPSEIRLAIIDALTQEGIAAWHGDATGCVEQMIKVQYDRAEKAERELAELKSTK